MKLTHCTNDFSPYDIWFLFDNASFINRRLLIGKCPICCKDIVCLIEERKSDNKVFKQIEIGKKSTDLIDRIILKGDVVNSLQDIRVKQGKGAPFGLCYGENKEVHNSKGEVIGIKINRCDFFGQKLTISDPRKYA